MEELQRKFSRWFRYDSSSKVTFVFIHGFFSDAKSCWHSETSWPELITQDKRFGLPNIFLVEYQTGINSLDYDVVQCAQAVYSDLSIPDEEYNSAPLAAQEIVFICHSQGGIIAREIFDMHYSSLSPKKIGLVLLASPSKGSKLGDFADKVFRAFGNTQLSGLRSIDNDHLDSLDTRFRRLLYEERIPQLFGAEAVEHRPMFFIPILSKNWGKVVEQNSASCYFGPPIIIPDTNHSTICKPDNKNHASHRFLLEFYLNRYHRNTTIEVKNLPVTTHKSSSPTSLILFDSLSSKSLPYYYYRNIDNIITATLSLTNIWITGPSGVGKTTIARAYILSGNFASIEICLSMYAEDLTEKNCTEEVASTIEQKQGIPFGTIGRDIRSISRELAKLAKDTTTILYFDEVPLDETKNTADIFSNFALKILNHIKDEHSCSNLKLIISSIKKPYFSSEKSGKAAERIKIVELSTWVEVELSKLFKLIDSSLETEYPDLKISRFREELLESTCGLPRNLKNQIRDIVLEYSSKDFTRKPYEKS